jgi:hypothetical protein
MHCIIQRSFLAMSCCIMTWRRLLLLQRPKIACCITSATWVFTGMTDHFKIIIVAGPSNLIWLCWFCVLVFQHTTVDAALQLGYTHRLCTCLPSIFPCNSRCRQIETDLLPKQKHCREICPFHLAWCPTQTSNEAMLWFWCSNQGAAGASDLLHSCWLLFMMILFWNIMTFILE